MTTELEEQFFKVYGVEKKCQCKNFINDADCFRIHTECKEYNYPEISDRKLLEMICIFSQHCNFGRWNKYAMHSIDDFKYIMLSQLIEYQNKRYTYGIKEKIQQLFKENQ